MILELEALREHNGKSIRLVNDIIREANDSDQLERLEKVKEHLLAASDELYRLWLEML